MLAHHTLIKRHLDQPGIRLQLQPNSQGCSREFRPKFKHSRSPRQGQPKTLNQFTGTRASARCDDDHVLWFAIKKHSCPTDGLCNKVMSRAATLEALYHPLTVVPGSCVNTSALIRALITAATGIIVQEPCKILSNNIRHHLQVWHPSSS